VKFHEIYKWWEIYFWGGYRKAIQHSTSCIRKLFSQVPLQNYVKILSFREINTLFAEKTKMQIIMANYIRFDWAMKRLLRDKANSAVLEGLMTTLLKEKIVIKKLLKSESFILNTTF